MLTPETYGLVIPWETDNPPTAEAISIEQTTVEYVNASYVGLRIEYTIDTDAERRRIIDEYRNYDPMQAFADIARASHNLPTRD